MRTCIKCYQKKELNDFRENRNSCRKCETAYTKLFFQSQFGKEYRKQWQTKDRIERPERSMLRAARKRAKQLNIPFNLSEEDIVIPEYCPVLGIKIGRNEKVSGPSSPTLDRIIPELGYVKGNVAVISKRANTIKNDASIADLEAVLAWLRTKVI